MKGLQLLMGLFGMLPACIMAQQGDTLRLRLEDAEQLFLKGNYELITQRYAIGEAEAEVITARLFNNPVLSYENQLYNRENKKFLEATGTNGQNEASLSQLITLAGKRNKNIQLAKTGVALAHWAYADLMRTLCFELRSAYYKAYFMQRSLSLYDRQIQSLEQVLAASAQQLDKGNIALKEVLRIRSALYGLRSEKNAAWNNLEAAETTLRQLMRVKPGTVLALADPGQEPQHTLTVGDVSYAALLDSARNNRPDIRAAEAGITYAQQNLALQKAQAVPDVELSLSYDRQGSFVNNYTGIGLSIPLPLFNRNQGEIKKARIAMDVNRTGLEQQRAGLEAEVFSRYQEALRAEKLQESMDPHFTDDFDKLEAGITRNYQLRNISLIEFLDFYDAYKENVLQTNDLSLERLLSREALNYVTGSSIF